jgi:hypothetical protein
MYALVTSIDLNGQERNLVVKKKVKTIFKVHHSNFLSVNIHPLDMWEMFKITSSSTMRTILEVEIDLNEIYEIPKKEDN